MPSISFHGEIKKITIMREPRLITSRMVSVHIDWHPDWGYRNNAAQFYLHFGQCLSSSPFWTVL